MAATNGLGGGVDLQLDTTNTADVGLITVTGGGLGSVFNLTDSAAGDVAANSIAGVDMSLFRGTTHVDLGSVVTGMSIKGGTGADNITGTAGTDTITGGAGDDVINGGVSADTLTGGLGTDTVSYLTSAAAVTVDLTLATAQVGGAGDSVGDVLSGFENVTGSNFADTLTGDANNNVITGGGGADTLTGGAGNDVFVFDNVAGWGDTITDFGTGAQNTTALANQAITGLNGDVLHFDLSNLAAMTAYTALATSATITGANGTTLNVADLVTGAGATANAAHAQFVQDTTTGILYFDADGTGAGAAAVQVAVVGTAALSNTAILLVA
jgi:serralysin